MRNSTNYKKTTDQNRFSAGVNWPQPQPQPESANCKLQAARQRTPDPGSRALHLGHRAFSISLVNSFRGNFVRIPMPWIVSPAARHLCPVQLDPILSTVRPHGHGPRARWLPCTLVPAQLPGSLASGSLPCRHHRRTGRVEHGYGDGFELCQKSPWMREL
jgi:hypothetical protein